MPDVSSSDLPSSDVSGTDVSSSEVSKPDAAVPRQRWADIAKGVCILLVVMWHVMTKQLILIDWSGHAAPIFLLWKYLNAELSPLRIPLFFLISGVFAHRVVLVGSTRRLRARCGGLLGLYVIWVLIQTALLGLVPEFDTEHATSLSGLAAELTFRPTNLWYLLALALYTLTGRLTRSLRFGPLLVAAFVVSATAATGVIPAEANLWQLLQNLPLFLIGLRCPALTHGSGRRQILVQRASPTRLAAWTGLVVILLVAVALTDSRNWWGVWPVLSAVSAFAGVTAGVVVDRQLPWLAAPLAWLGRRTLPVYVLHLPVLALLSTPIHTVAAHRSSGVAAALAPPVLTALCVTISLTVYVALRAMRLQAMFEPTTLDRIISATGNRWNRKPS